MQVPVIVWNALDWQAGTADATRRGRRRSVLHAVYHRTYREDSRRELNRHHVNPLPEAGSNHSSPLVRGGRREAHMLVVEGIPEVAPNLAGNAPLGRR